MLFTNYQGSQSFSIRQFPQSQLLKSNFDRTAVKNLNFSIAKISDKAGQVLSPKVPFFKKDTKFSEVFNDGLLCLFYLNAKCTDNYSYPFLP